MPNDILRLILRAIVLLTLCLGVLVPSAHALTDSEQRILKQRVDSAIRESGNRGGSDTEQYRAGEKAVEYFYQEQRELDASRAAKEEEDRKAASSKASGNLVPITVMLLLLVGGVGYIANHFVSIRRWKENRLEYLKKFTHENADVSGAHLSVGEWLKDPDGKCYLHEQDSLFFIKYDSERILLANGELRPIGSIWTSQFIHIIPAKLKPKTG